MIRPPAPRGSGQALGTVARLAANFTMAADNTEEDVTGMSVTFTYDGRPVNIVCTSALTSQEDAAIKLITLKLCRSTDNASQALTVRGSSATANEIQPQAGPQTGPITAWPSDAAPFVVGTPYTVKLRVTSGSGCKATISGATQPTSLFVVTA